MKQRPLATPLARRMAEALSLDLTGITGTGFDGKITKADLLRVPAGGGPETESAPPPGESAPPAHETVAATVKVDVTALAALCPPGGPLSPGDFVLLAAARALEGTGTQVHLAVALPLEGGVALPVVRRAGELSPGGLAPARKKLAQRARPGGAEAPGDGLIIYDMAALGLESFVPGLTGGETAALGAGAVGTEPDLEEGLLTARQVLRLSLVCSAAQAAFGLELLDRVGRLLARPMDLMIGGIDFGS